MYSCAHECARARVLLRMRFARGGVCVEVEVTVDVEVEEVVVVVVVMAVAVATKV